MSPRSFDERGRAAPREQGGPHGGGRAAGTDLLGDLVHVVTERARRIHATGGQAEADLEALREAVDALGGLLDALALVAKTSAHQTGPRPTRERADPPPGPTAPASGSPADQGAGRVADGDRRLASFGDPRDAADLRNVRDRRGATDPRGAPEPRALEAHGPRTPVPGLYTREAFESIVAGELKRCTRHDRVLTLALVRLSSRDSASIGTAARILRSSLRVSDVSGLDESGILAIALPETDLEEARTVASRLIPNLDAAGTWGRDGGIGLAVFPAEGETLWTLLEGARRQLGLPVERVLASSADGGYWSG